MLESLARCGASATRTGTALSWHAAGVILRIRIILSLWSIFVIECIINVGQMQNENNVFIKTLLLFQLWVMKICRIIML